MAEGSPARSAASRPLPLSPRNNRRFRRLSGRVPERTFACQGGRLTLCHHHYRSTAAERPPVATAGMPEASVTSFLRAVLASVNAAARAFLAE
ncbi:hypothetical protein MTO96_015834 [Rhipicephalus appendiculatus]